MKKKEKTYQGSKRFASQALLPPPSTALSLASCYCSCWHRRHVGRAIDGAVAWHITWSLRRVVSRAPFVLVLVFVVVGIRHRHRRDSPVPFKS